MKFKGQLIVLLLCLITKLFADQPSDPQINLNSLPQVFDIDSILNSLVSKPIDVSDSIMSFNADSAKFIQSTTDIPEEVLPELNNFDDLIPEIQNNLVYSYKIPTELPLLPVDTLVLLNNPFFINLVFTGIKLDFNWKKADLKTLYYGNEPKTIADISFKTPQLKKEDEVIYDLRNKARNEISRTAANLYSTTFDQLPNPESNKNNYIKGLNLDKIIFVEKDMVNPYDSKINIIKEKVSPWSKKAQGMVQFSQNLVSGNWYQGGNSNMAVLGVLTGQMNYDNKKNIQFENNAEWRMGFYFVDDSTALRPVNTNNDILKVNSKLGFKINGNWFYSGSIDFSTQFLNNYQAVNSEVLKASFLTPVRLNVGIGLDYKYKKIFSLALSPLSYKYIYVNDTTHVNQNLFGVKKDENKLSEVGSAFKATLSYSPVREIQIDSKLSFFTNYEKVEVDWEIVGTFVVNRFLSTRLSINPRYDNTVIMTNGEKARIQFKELLSFGFSYKLID
ncbi:MAG: DUF3078 domain-containing protein [Paludibacter sp.]|nr:DUF3078 domain-containing protein [Paludibacter sp.]